MRRPFGSTRGRRLLPLAFGVLLLSVPPTSAAALEPPPDPAIDEAPPGWPEAPVVGAEAFILVEGASGQVLAGQRADERRPVASTIKVLTALTALERVDLDDEVTAGDEVIGVGGASVGLSEGDTWTVEELTGAIIARSGNEAAQALAVHTAGTIEAFLGLMGEDLATIGLPGIALTDVSGLDDGNRLSAADLATIARVALAHQELRPLLAEPVVTLPDSGEVESRNELLTRYPGATGVKTGFTQAAGNSLVGSARRGDRELVAVVLGSGDDPARFDAAAALLDHGFDAFRTTTLTGSLRFVLAGDGAVDLLVEPVELSVPTEASAHLQLPVQARPPEQAPTVPIAVDGDEVVVVPTTLRHDESSPVGSDAGIGRSLVDGAYAALRASAAAGSLR